jgi:hypothetical protein
MRRLTHAQDTDKSVLRQICCIKGIADLSAQPALQPAVMICVKRGDFTMGGCFDNGHGAMGG